MSIGKTQPAPTQDTFVQHRAQEALHQHGKSRLLRFFPCLHLQGQQRSPSVVGKKPGVAHHLKMARYSARSSLSGSASGIYASPCSDRGSDEPPRRHSNVAGGKPTRANASVSGPDTSRCARLPVSSLQNALSSSGRIVPADSAATDAHRGCDPAPAACRA